MINLEEELGKVTKYARHKNFSPDWNRSIAFIYGTFIYEEVIRQAYIVAKQREFETNEFVQFAVTRWYNFHTNAFIGELLDEFPDISLNAGDNHSRNLVIKGETFDYRCTFYPRQFYLPVEYSIQKPKSLLRWFYQNQNRNVYFGNRLFIILHDREQPNNSWKLRGRLSLVRETFEKAFRDGVEFIDFEFTKNNATYHPKCAVVFLTKGIEESETVEDMLTDKRKDPDSEVKDKA
jgi:hypothetical protein